jgi:hypothetical protein
MENGVFSFSLLSGVGFEAPTSICDIYTEVAIDQLKTRHDSRSPFFMFLSQEVHCVVDILLCEFSTCVPLSLTPLCFSHDVCFSYSDPPYVVSYLQIIFCISLEEMCMQQWHSWPAIQRNIEV